jgi:ribosome-associated translation inhibitor RaiA
MNIEIDIPHNEVKEWLISQVRDKLIELHHMEKSLHRASVHFKLNDKPGSEKVCEIEVPMFGSSLFIHRAASSFEQASREVLQELSNNIIERHAARNEPPDIITSSVKI